MVQNLTVFSTLLNLSARTTIIIKLWASDLSNLSASVRFQDDLLARLRPPDQPQSEPDWLYIGEIQIGDRDNIL
ncbi:hypothetical protein PGT21_008872 [Puccinia graminis f. sp. tritici]|uniref:Uncharacterized protein n=1 Tax=Puccinia graminis f. sp. tritici TaxID=56615 RepID=A0A5B0S0Q4_PUCGR|nr:hypothetical protein PGT21_008872 [Puccinia graminis f. sp. tritici]KAA1131437.1 hypothetical protein PGTUg99_014253 [Puccinia graminis f. sp. tritici]